MNAADVMTRNVVTVERRTPIREAIRLMLANKVSGLPVVDAAGKVEGILTEGDLLRRSEIATERRHWPWLDFLLGPGRTASEYVRTHGRTCEQLMSHDVVSVAPDTSLADIVQLMERRRIKRLPVMQDGNLLGIVSRPDLLAAVARALDAPQAPVAGDDAHPRPHPRRTRKSRLGAAFGADDYRHRRHRRTRRRDPRRARAHRPSGRRRKRARG